MPENNGATNTMRQGRLVQATGPTLRHRFQVFNLPEDTPAHTLNPISSTVCFCLCMLVLALWYPTYKLLFRTHCIEMHN